MSQLHSHVDQLFRGYKQTKQIAELKEEILSNLEAKAADLISTGMPHTEAIRKSIASIDHVDFLMDGRKRIRLLPYSLELLQIALLYVLVAWVITIPLAMLGKGIVLNTLLLVIVIIAGLLFLILQFNKKWVTHGILTTYHYKGALRLRRLAWLLWSLFVILMTLNTTALQFGSNLWFSRPVTLSGPYQFAIVGVRYALPFISIIIPLLIHASLRLAPKYEAGDAQ
ncbi:permease prefix domain 1-containing protein [Paenibacillus mendelii]|uniref:Permease prefix domain 1-containing protein n=1 Tax=Paenibacillus mendelii TaxID=206163 RepID=A0ABV6J7Z1_9BACL|nr:permease prefix domain 1-containing protein [Paenibacillus mendelii]MCQ6561391.1 permease prefix domain 1-containing protein [Paenibacillus mendelii]